MSSRRPLLSLKISSKSLQIVPLRQVLVFSRGSFDVSTKAVFLDRDGVINVKLPENQYVRRPSELVLLPGVREALRILGQLGYLIIVVTNQRGIGRGFMTVDDLGEVHDHLKRELEKGNARIDAIYYCPHDVSECCTCRKPEPGLLLAALSEWDVDATESFMVGDSASDVVAGSKAGIVTVRIAQEKDEAADMSFSSLIDFARYLESIHNGRN